MIRETAFVGFSHSNSPSLLANLLPAILVSYSTAFSLFLHAVALPLVALSSARKHNEASKSSLIKGSSYFLLFHAMRVIARIVSKIRVWILRLIFHCPVVQLHGSSRYTSASFDGLEDICSATALRASFRGVLVIWLSGFNLATSVKCDVNKFYYCVSQKSCLIIWRENENPMP